MAASGDDQLVDADQLDRQLQEKLKSGNVVLRILPLGGAILLVMIALAILSGATWNELSRPNIRGTWARGTDVLLMASASVGVVITVLLVWDAARVCERYARNLGRGRSIRKSQSEPSKYEPESSLQDVQSIADATARVNSLIYWPFVLIAILLVSLHPRFEFWVGRSADLWLFGGFVAIVVVAAYRLRRAAEAVRHEELERLQRFRADETDPQKKSRAEYVINTVKEIRRGAFGHWSEDPVVRLAILPLVGFVSIRAVELAGTYFRA